MEWAGLITEQDWEADGPALALRRHTDRCFFRVQELVPEAGGGVRGFVVDGVLVPADEVAELRRTGADGGAVCGCGPTRG
jgi:hypothetical protein